MNAPALNITARPIRVDYAMVAQIIAAIHGPRPDDKTPTHSHYSGGFYRADLSGEALVDHVASIAGSWRAAGDWDRRAFALAKAIRQETRRIV